MVEVYIPTPYRSITGEARLQVEAATVKELLETLAQRYPDLRPRLFEGDAIAHHLNVYVNKREIRTLQGAETPLQDGDEVALIPAMAGGSGDAPAGPLLTDQQMERYSRHVRLPEVGVEGQRKLLDSKVAIVGAGALGSPAAIYLAAAGVGTIGIIDGDRVDVSNLHRQILYFDHDQGRPKTQAARRHLEDINPDVRVIEHRTFLNSQNALEILKDYDVVINGSDNFATRYLVNDACVLLGKPLVDASILRFEAQATVFMPGRGCYRCLFPAPPPPGMVPSCAEAGVLGALAGHMGTLQALEAIKILLGIGETLAEKLLIYDALNASYQILHWQRNPNCPVCGDHPTIKELIDYEAFCGVPLPGNTGARANGRATVAAGGIAPATAGGPAARDRAESRQDEPGPQAVPAAEAARDRAAAGSGELPDTSQGPADLSPVEARRLVEGGQVQIIDVRDPWEFERDHIPGARLMPLAQLGARLEEIDPERPLLMVCEVGERSRLAAEFLHEAGFPAVYNLKGGMIAWRNYRLPVEAGSGR
ncbi:MoaD family protein [Thermaerobacter marianensis DSM 12885]|uniref:MoaD family protein n=1 Tax=Thermaerobacter marianensis (strain ATCC 700841 / DSM 12885 / JCM 10246 / 7p75a) TaxID=644966 RepID=E6SK75_THEM7|nr:MoaD family protein [Thermaerobacter marianensis DSM 12885]